LSRAGKFFQFHLLPKIDPSLNREGFFIISFSEQRTSHCPVERSSEWRSSGVQLGMSEMGILTSLQRQPLSRISVGDYDPCFI
jgi:hypothetical protein